MELYRAHACIFAEPDVHPQIPRKLWTAFRICFLKNGLDKEVKVVKTGCFGLCAEGPVVVIYRKALCTTVLLRKT